MSKEVYCPFASRHSASTFETCAKREPLCKRRRSFSKLLRGPCATTSTVESGMFFTYPTRASCFAFRRTKSLYITICTRPDTIARNSCISPFYIIHVVTDILLAVACKIPRPRLAVRPAGLTSLRLALCEKDWHTPIFFVSVHPVGLEPTTFPV